MKYDLIVVGAGPGGLMAARTAARDGMKVLVLERKRNITEIKRACVQIFYLKKHDANWLSMKLTPRMDAYTEKVSVEFFADFCRFNYLEAGFSLDYQGTMRPLYNWYQLSPTGKHMMRYPKDSNFPWGYFYSKETFLTSLLADVEKAGAEVRAETTAQSAVNVDGGVEVTVKTKTGEQTLRARGAIAADGLKSSIVESLGLNKERPPRSSRPRQVLMYYLEGVECPYGDTSWLMWDIPSLKANNIYMGLGPGKYRLIGAGSAAPEVPPASIIEGIMKWPAYASWFANARIVGKMGTSLVARPGLKQMTAGNIVIAGDAGASVECWIQGAVVGGYKAVKAIQKQWDGQDGYGEYNDWWAKAFAFNRPEHSSMSTDPMRGGAASVMSVISQFNDQDMDDIFAMFEGQQSTPALMAAANADLIKQKRPDLYRKMLIPGK